MGIVTPLILSILVCVALRLISYTETRPDRIVHGLRWGEEGEGKSEQGSPTCLRNEVKSERNTYCWWDSEDANVSYEGY